MNKLLKIGLTAAIALAFVVTANAGVYSTNVLAGSGAVHLLSTERQQIYQIQITATNSIVVDFYDQDSLDDPYFGTNYVTAAYTNVVSWPTNLVVENIGITGYTNVITNVGIHTVMVNNAAATNALPKQLSVAVTAGEVATVNTSAIFTKGVVARVAGTGTAGTLVYYYSPN